MMKRIVCIGLLAFMSNIACGAPEEQDDWGFAIENNSGSSYQSAPTFYGPSYNFAPINPAPFRAFVPPATYVQPAYGARPYYTPYAPGTAPRTFVAPFTGPVYQSPPTYGFF